jgi:hypothetical protein
LLISFCSFLSPSPLTLEDGEYSADLMGFTGGCKAWDPTSPGVTPSDIAARHHNYRVTIAEEVMREYQVPVLHVFNTSLRIPDAHQAHPGAGDCRHWFNPSSVLEHWATVLYNMVVPPDE